MNLHTALRDLADGVLDLVLAPTCAACRAPVAREQTDRLVCATCWSRARAIPAPRCDRCGSPRPSQPAGPTATGCATCSLLPPALRAVRSAFVHEGPVRGMVHALKFGGWWSIAGPLAERMAAVPLPLEAEQEVRWVVPVPLGAARLRERGFNQAELLARAYAVARGWTCRPDVLRRARSTDRQATLHPAERRANVTGAFQAAPEAHRDLRGEHVLLVDDVWTTGATAVACGSALVAGGARAYSVVTFARALPELNR